MTNTLVVEALKDIQLTDPDGNRVRLGDSWKEQPVVLVFIRHFG